MKHVVKLSALGAEIEDPNVFQWAHMHREIEDKLRNEGITLTSLRPSSFFTNIWLDKEQLKQVTQTASLLSPMTLMKGVIYDKACGDGRINLISNEDIGEAAAVILAKGGHEGKDYSLTGPETLSWREYAKVLSEELGKPINVIPISEAQMRELFKDHFPSKEAMDGFCNMMAYFRDGGYDKQSDHVKMILGKEPRSVRPFLRANKDQLLA